MSDMHLTKRRLLGGIAMVAAAAALVACSDEKSPASTAQTSPAVDTTLKTSATASTKIPEAEGDVDMAKALQPGALPEMAIGKEDAPVQIIEYMSMTCPHCAHFHNTTFDEIKKKYVDTGKARFILREFPFDPRAAAAFMLARCAPKEQYFPMVSMLFKQQETWAAATDGRNALLQMAKMAGFTQESFEKCLTDQTLLDNVNSVRERGEKEFGVNATPTFLINGKRYPGAMTVESMSALLDSLQ